MREQQEAKVRDFMKLPDKYQLESMKGTSPTGSIGRVGTCPLVKEQGDPCPHVLQGVINSVGRGDHPDPGDLGQLWKAALRRAEAKLGRISPKTLSARLKEIGADDSPGGTQVWVGISPTVCRSLLEVHFPKNVRWLLLGLIAICPVGHELCRRVFSR